MATLGMGAAAEPWAETETTGRPQPPALQAALDAMATGFHAEWARRFSRPGSSPCASLDGDILTLRLEDALTHAERTLSAHPDGALAVRRSLDLLLSELYPWLADAVEARLNCFVAESHVDLDLSGEGASVLCRLSLRDLPRAYHSPSVRSSCE